MHRFLLACVLAILALDSASAHTGVGATAGFAHGLNHPLSGLDHILAMLAVGLFAAMLRGRALWLVPLSFVAMMIAGCAFGLAGMMVPVPELGIGLSVIVLGIVVALGVRMPLAGAMALAGFFAIFHGYAHGAEMPGTASGLTYAAGFTLATAALHAAGVGLGLGAGRLGQAYGRRAAQGAGALIAVIGLVLLTVAV